MKRECLFTMYDTSMYFDIILNFNGDVKSCWFSKDGLIRVSEENLHDGEDMSYVTEMFNKWRKCLGK